ncbi:MAG: T9SS type A sorting domain-containing protein [Chlorobiota bacterium]|nr:MAG: T9SS type A sorting domain-containing protein [Chlorobiota bacterium]
MRNILKVILFFAICGFANAQNMQTDTCPKNPCNKPTGCPDKKYPYHFDCFISSGQTIVNDFETCISNPHAFITQNGTKIMPARIKLPLCAEFDKDTLYNTNNPQEKMYDTFCLYPKHKKVVAVNDTAIVKDTVCIFDIKKIHCDLAVVLDEWNCLCDKQNDSCKCKLKIRFSNRPEDFLGEPLSRVLGINRTKEAGINKDDSCRGRCPTETGIFINFSKGVTDRSDTVNIFYYNGESSDSTMQSNLQKLRSGIGGQTKAVSMRDLLEHELGHTLLRMEYVDSTGRGTTHYYERDSLGNKILSRCDSTIDGIMRGGGGGGNANREGLSQDDKCMFMKLYCQSGISEVEFSSSDANRSTIIAYPNPTNYSLHIKFRTNRAQNVKVFLIDVKGKKIEDDLIKQFETGEQLFTIDASSFNNGKYFCTIEHDGITETISFVIQK